MAAKTKDIGHWGEQRATDFLKSKGWIIEKTNWIYQRWEVDIIAWERNILVFVEVKTRKNNRFGHPEQFVSPHKAGLIKKAASEFTRSIQYEGFIRFDIISITGSTQSFELHHLEDAF